MLRLPPRATQCRSSAASDVYTRQAAHGTWIGAFAPIRDNDGQVVALLQVDTPLDRLLEESNRHTTQQALFALLLLVVLVCAMNLASHRLTRALTLLAQAAKRFGHGDFKTKITAHGATSEIEELAGALETARQEISEQVDAQQLTEAQLAEALAKAKAATEVKSQFLANMSHELRTPLNAIIGFSEIISNQMFGPVGQTKYVDYATDIRSSGAHLLSIINDILDLAKIEAGHASVQEQVEFEIGPAISSAVRMVAPLAERRGVDLAVLSCPEPVRLIGVERMIRQVLVNVMSNAVKFTEEGGSVTVVTERRAGGSFRISVMDTGIGMSSEEVKIALTPFGQADNMLTRKHEGTGLGLPLANAMMELHGGRLLVKSKPGRGTTIVLLFPAARVSVASPEETVAARASS